MLVPPNLGLPAAVLVGSGFRLGQRRVGATMVAMLQPPTTIDLAEDSRLDAFRNLKGGARRRNDLFVAESELVLDRLFASGAVVRSILVTEARRERVTESYTTHARGSQERPIDVFVATHAVIDSVVGYPLHRGVIAVAERPQIPEAGPVLAAANTVVVMEEVTDPDNVGAVFRHSAGFGVDAVLLCGTTGDPLYRKTLRTSMGWTLEIPYAHIPVTDSYDLQQTLHDAGFVTLALTPARDAEVLANVLSDLAPSAKVALLLGAEGPGLRATTMERADHRVRIPLTDGVDSLNVASAAAVALYALTTAQPARLNRAR